MNVYFPYFKVSSLLGIVFTLLVIKYGLFEPFQIATALDNFHYALLIIATTCVACAGSVIHTIFDRNALSITAQKEVAKPRLFTETQEYSVFIALNVIGVAIGFYLSHYIDRSGFSSFFILISALLYLQASYLQQFPFIGNLMVALFAVLLLLVPGIFDLQPAITPENRGIQATIFSILLDYAALTFVLSILQELVNDCSNMDQQQHTGMRTIPMLLGRDRTMKLVSVLTLLPIAMIFWYSYTYLFHNTIAIGYGLLALIAPLLYFMFKCWTIENNQQLSFLNTLLHIVLFLVVCSLILYHLILSRS